MNYPTIDQEVVMSKNLEDVGLLEVPPTRYKENSIVEDLFERAREQRSERIENDGFTNRG